MAHIAIDARIINSTTGRYIERLLHHLESLDTINNYTVIVPTKDKDFWIPRNKNFTVLTADFPNYSFAEQLGFKSFLDTLNPDLVHFCMPQQPALYKGDHITSFLDLTLLRTYSSDKNRLVFRAKQFVGRWLFKYVAKTSKHLITISDYVKNDVVSFSKVSPDKVTTTYLAGETTTVAISEYPTPSKSYLLYVGRQADHKNIPRLAEAHQELLKIHPDTWLVLAGKMDDNARANQKLFTEHGYKNIHFTDFIPDDQLNWLYENAEAYVFPSLMEGFGLPGLEAMAHDTPLVSSNATCLPEIYGEAAHYFDPTSTTDITRAITDVLDNKELREKLIANGSSQVKKYSWEKMAKETLAVYKKVLNQD